jgi:pyrimidine-specific ribonucleoside hydrolase
MLGRWTTHGRLLALVTITVVLAACASTVSPSVTTVGPSGTPGEPATSPAASQGPTSLIVDTDMGADDIMAILYLLRDPAVDVRAIVVSGTGLAHARKGVQNVSDLLGAMGRNDVPVAIGSNTPMEGDRAFPADWRTGTDSAYGLRLASVPMVPTSAVELISSTLKASASPMTVLTLGPLTDLGEALTADPSLAGKIARLHISGGAVDVPGNVAAEGGDPAATAAEWNLWIDPKADDIVLRAGIPITLVPLDATTKLPLTAAFTERLAQDHAAAGADLVYELLARNQSVLAGNYFWDQLAAVLLTDPTAATFADARVSVAARGAAAGSLTRDPNGIAVQYAVAPDAGQFEARFLDGLRSGAPRPAALAATPVPSTSGVGPQYVVGTETLSVTTQGTQRQVGAVTQLRGQVLASVDTMNDPRVAGTGAITANADQYGTLGPQWGTYRLENAQGAWEGRWTGAAWDSGNAVNVTGWLVGSGDYKGYTYFLHVWGANDLQVEGILFKGPQPTTAPTPASVPSTGGTGPAHVAGTATSSLTTPFTQTQEGDITQFRGGIISGTDTMDDPRVSGTETVHLSVDGYGTDVGTEWATSRLVNAGGAWVGRCSGGAWAAGGASAVACWLVGSGGYTGYTYYVSNSTSGSSGVIEGIIFPGSPPKP